MTDRLAHEITPDGESTEKWAMREPGFFGSVRRLICCARCGGSLPPGYDRPRKVYGALTTSMYFLCDECHEALPDAQIRWQQEREELQAALSTAREDALRMAAGKAKVAWMVTPYGSIADADAMCAMCEELSETILALIPQPMEKGS